MSNLADLTVKIGTDDKDLDKGLSGAESKVSSFAGKIGKAAKVAGGAAGAAGGAALAVGFATNLSTESAAAKLSAQLGSTGSLSKAAGEAAGKLYADGYGENLGAVNDAVRAVVQSGALMGDESSAAIEKISKGAINLAAIMGTDVQGSMNAVAQMVKTGLAPNAEVAMDILEKGFQVGNDKAGDLLDTFNEYGTQFRKLGLDGQTAMGIIQQGLKAGARDADVVADAIKEFAIRAVDGSKLTGEGFQAIGLSADDMASKIAAGGPTAAAALDLTLDRLRAMKDPVAQSAAAVALFGTQAEDLGKALIAIDPSSAVAGLGQFQGTMKQVDAATTTTETKITVIQRAVEGWTASLASSKGPLGDVAASVLAFGGPATAYASQLGMIALSLKGLGLTAVLSAAQSVASTTGAAAVVVARWVWMATVATVQAGRTALAWVIGFVAGSAMTIATMTLTAASVVAQWIVMGAVATAQALRSAAAWVIGFLAGSAMAVAVMAATAVSVVAGWVLMGTQALLRAGQMAAAWFIAMGPIGWAIAAVVGIAALVIANWDRVKGFTVAAWNAISGAVASGIGTVLGFLGGLPGRALGALGDVTGMFWTVGMNIIRGIANGLQAGWSWLTGIVSNIARSLFSAAKSALGIASPSKLFHYIGDQVGAGLAGGIAASQGLVTSAAAKLAMSATTGFSPITVRSAATAGAALAAPAGVAATGGANVPTIELRSDGSRLGDLLVEVLRKAIHGLGGDVQAALGS